MIFVIQKKRLYLNNKIGKAQSAMQFTYILHLGILNLHLIVCKFSEALKLSTLVTLISITAIVTILNHSSYYCHIPYGYWLY